MSEQSTNEFFREKNPFDIYEEVKAERDRLAEENARLKKVLWKNKLEVKPIEETLQELANEVPDEEWKKLEIND